MNKQRPHDRDRAMVWQVPKVLVVGPICKNFARTFALKMSIPKIKITVFANVK